MNKTDRKIFNYDDMKETKIIKLSNKKELYKNDEKTIKEICNIYFNNQIHN